MKALHLTFGLIAALIAGGCASTAPCRLTVGNLGDAAISNVVVKAGERVLYTVDRIPSKARAGYLEVYEDLPRSFVLSWQAAGGPAQSKNVESQGPIPKDFRGRIYFQVAAAEVKLFVMPDSVDQGSDMPWAKPESWEGFPALPGFTPE